MQNEPLSASEHLKIIIFIPLLIPSIFPALIGIVPVLFLVFGYYMMRKNHDFSSLEVSVKAAEICYKVVMFLSLAVTALCLILFLSNNNPLKMDYNSLVTTTEIEIALSTGLLAAVCFTYVVILEHLYFIPFKNHRVWVIANGVFSNQPKVTPQANKEHGIDILLGGNTKKYSVADELAKWAKLQEDGHISESDFEEARSKLLRRS